MDYVLVLMSSAALDRSAFGCFQRHRAASSIEGPAGSPGHSTRRTPTRQGPSEAYEVITASL
jgi:hypothetical protein